MTANRKQKFIRWLCKTISLTSVAFIFHACYGMPMDCLNGDVHIEGYVTSANDNKPIPNIKISVENYPNYDFTDDYGCFHMHLPIDSCFKFIFSDNDGTENGSYLTKDTVVINSYDEIYIHVSLDEK